MSEKDLKAHHSHQQSFFKNTNKLIVHVIPHSHDDVGWLKTVDDYYYGKNNKNLLARSGVQYTIDTVVKELMKNQTRKFIQVEVAFFYIWWNQQTQQMKDQVKILVQNGQLEFINGGWCMNDEATTYYEDIIEQMTVGHQPTIGWHIDPFGHSSSQAAIFSQMGFQAFFFGRIDSQDQAKRLRKKALEMIWHPKQESGIDKSIFTHVNFFLYMPPPTFCYDQFCWDNPIEDDPRLQKYNIEQRSQEFVYYFRNMSLHYRSNNLMHTFGSDFQYTNAHLWYKNLDKLIQYINENSQKFNMEVKYSTPSEYIKEINKENNIYPTKFDDFFPYMDIPGAYWTGYFTSRVSLKGNVKSEGRFLQNTRNYLTLLKFYNLSQFINNNEKIVQNNLENLERAVSVLQHHDAVAGTETQFVANDYTKILNNAKENFHKNVFSKILKEQTQVQLNSTFENFEQCNWNISSSNCEIIYNNLINKKPIILTVLNPSNLEEQIIRLKVPHSKFDVYNLQDKEKQTTVCDVICANETDSTDCDAFFISQLQGFQLNYYKLLWNNNPKNTSELKKQQFGVTELKKTFDVGIKKQITIYKFSSLFEYQTQENLTHSFQINYNFYKSFQEIGQKSGAYIFAPDFETFFSSLPYSIFLQKIGYVGRILTSIHLIGEKTDSFIRFFNFSNQYAEKSIELETYVQSIDISDNQGKEIILEIISNDINNNQTFLTDSNGLEMQKRIKNFRPTWDLFVTSPISGNYYPINSAIKIVDQKNNKGMCVMNDRSQGGTSLKEGQIELMIHRRILHDDLRGVGECKFFKSKFFVKQIYIALNETETWDQKKGLSQKIKHWIVFFDNSSKFELDVPRFMQKYNDVSPLAYISQLEQNQMKFKIQEEILNLKKMKIINNLDQFSKFQLKFLEDNKYLFRINNLNEQDTFTYIGEFQNVTEMTLTANQLKSDWLINKMNWKEEDYQQIINKNEKLSYIEKQLQIQQKNDYFTIQVKPLEIKTFIVYPLQQQLQQQQQKQQ